MDNERYGHLTPMYNDWQANLAIIKKHKPTSSLLKDKDKILLDSKENRVFYRDHRNLDVVKTLYKKYNVHPLTSIYYLFEAMTNKAKTVADNLRAKKPSGLEHKSLTN